ncbi:MAG: glycosyltransferase family 4 protein [Lachnospiraceae bacterium]
MNVVFVSNYINHHQIPLSQELNQYCLKDGGSYYFIQVEEMEQERVEMGWDKALQDNSFLLSYFEDARRCQSLIDEADVVIFGGIEDVSYIKNRLKDNKCVWRYCERLYRTGRYKFITPRGLLRKFKDHTQYAFRKNYLLCSGGYVAGDFRMVGAYPGKKFKFGYFPEFIEYDVEQLFLRKSGQTSGKVMIFWAARMIALKHPEDVVLLAKKLKERNCNFEVQMAGGGVLESDIRELIKLHNLDDCVKMLGFLSPQNTRRKMEEADIFLATSGVLEGWGAVINEAMNSACVVIANKKMGAVPYLMKDRYNGIVYGNLMKESVLHQIEEVITDKELRRSYSENAYDTIKGSWNAPVAANRLYKAMKASVQERKIPCFVEGPLSK